MKKIIYKGRCEKRKVSKCEDVCRTYSKIQSEFVNLLEKDEDIVSFECNVRLKGVADDLYSTDIVAKKADGSTMVRECVWRIRVLAVSQANVAVDNALSGLIKNTVIRQFVVVTETRFPWNSKSFFYREDVRIIWMI